MKALRDAAYQRRFRSRQLLFGLGGGLMPRLSEKERAFVRMVREEAYQVYLHLFHTGESRYGGWKKRRQLQLVNRRVPMTRKQYARVWYGSQKARYFNHDLPKAIRESLHATPTL